MNFSLFYFLFDATIDKVFSFDLFNELIVRDLETRRFLAVFPIKREFV